MYCPQNRACGHGGAHAEPERLEWSCRNGLYVDLSGPGDDISEKAMELLVDAINTTKARVLEKDQGETTSAEGGRVLGKVQGKTTAANSWWKRIRF